MNKLDRKIRKRIVAHTGDATNVQKYRSGDAEGKKPIRRIGVMEDNIKKIVKETPLDLSTIYFVQDTN